MADKLGGVGPGDAARGVIPVLVGVENVADGDFKPARDFALEPPREVAVDRVAHDDPVGRHQEDCVVVVVLRAIELAGDVDDAALRRLLSRGVRREADEHAQRHNDACGKSHDDDLHIFREDERLWIDALES